MKIVVLFALVALAAAEEEYYNIPIDLAGIQGIVGDIERLQEYMDCYLDKGECNELSSTIRKLIPEIVEQACKKCSPIQKHLAARFIQTSKMIIPKDYEEIKAKYDPENKYFDSFEDEVFKYIDAEQFN